MTTTSITELTLNIKMHAPVDQERLVADLREHVAPLIEQGCRSGEMLISDDADNRAVVRGWWTVTTKSPKVVEAPHDLGMRVRGSLS
jgi:hypothetical protein